MLIIVEGPDCSGKTTFVKYLTEYIVSNTSARVIGLRARPPKPGSDSFKEYVQPLMGYRPTDPFHVICDRWHLGERIYPKVLGRDTDMNRDVFDEVEKFLELLGAIIVRPYVGTYTLKKRIIERGDDLITPQMLGSIAYGYNCVFRQTRLPVMTYDPLTINLTLFMQHVVDEAIKRQEAMRDNSHTR
jgi:thymidylate kinase